MIVPRLARQALRMHGRRAASDYAPSHYKPPTMDDLPVPSGSWSEINSKVQAKNNMKLAGALLFLAATVGISYQSGKFEFNLAPPMKN